MTTTLNKDLDTVRDNHEKMQALLANANATVEEEIIPVNDTRSEEELIEVETITEEEAIAEYQASHPMNLKLSDKSGLNFKEIKSHLSSTGQMVIDGFIDYIDNMDPRKKMTPKEGVRHQAALWRTLSTMFNKLIDDEFERVYKAALLLFFHHRDDVFKEDAVYRYPEHWEMSENDRTAFRKLVTLMIITRDPRTRRAAAEEIKAWDAILAFGLTDEAKSRVVNFYRYY